MDLRRALPAGTVLDFRNSEGGRVSYRILGEIGRGGSCIVYNASYRTGAEDLKTIRVKECCPFGLKLRRSESGALVSAPEDEEEFARRKNAFKQAFLKSNHIFAEGEAANCVSNTIDWYEANGTCYIVSTYLHGETLADHQPASLRECVALCAAAAKAVEQIHQAGYLYLDLKPENIFVIHGTSELVQLFDFDSLASLSDPADRPERISFTRGFAALELQRSQMNRLAPSTDVFSIGAVLFYLLFGRTPDAFDCSGDAAYDWRRMNYAGHDYADPLYAALEEFFHHTLSSYQPDRYRTAAEAIGRLNAAIKYADEDRLFLASTPLNRPYLCVGREEPLRALDALLSENATVSVSGMGGIGKSTLVREYIGSRRAKFDAVLWLYWSGDIRALLTDDRKVCLHTVRKDAKETRDEYFLRKLKKLRELAARDRLLIVLDDFDPDGFQQLPEMLETGCKTILISRKPLPEGLVPALPVGRLADGEALRILAAWGRDAVSGERNEGFAEEIVRNTNGHTLLLELIGKLTAAGSLTAEKAAALTRTRSLASAAGDPVDYIRDAGFVHERLRSVLGRLMEDSRLSAGERSIMKLLSAFDHPGIDRTTFAELSGLGDWSRLEQLGWVRREEETLSVHPVTAEYFSAMDWAEYQPAAEAFMERLHQRIHGDPGLPDPDKRFPRYGSPLYDDLELAGQIAGRCSPDCAAKSELIYHLVVDSPVDREEEMLKWSEKLLSSQALPDPKSVLNVFSHTALLQQKMGRYEEAETALRRMRRFLRAHPSAFYLAQWHNVKALSAWNACAENHARTSLAHWDRAILLARRSKHPKGRILLAECLLHKLTSLLDLEIRPRACERILYEVIGLAENGLPEDAYEVYQFWCVAAHWYAQMAGDRDQAEECMKKASEIAWERRDSDLAWADHLYDERFPLAMCFGDWDAAEDILAQAIAVCGKHAGIAPYDRKRTEITNCLRSMKE